MVYTKGLPSSVVGYQLVFHGSKLIATTDMMGLELETEACWLKHRILFWKTAILGVQIVPVTVASSQLHTLAAGMGHFTLL